MNRANGTSVDCRAFQPQNLRQNENRDRPSAGDPVRSKRRGDFNIRYCEEWSGVSRSARFLDRASCEPSAGRPLARLP